MTHQERMSIERTVALEPIGPDGNLESGNQSFAVKNDAGGNAQQYDERSEIQQALERQRSGEHRYKNEDGNIIHRVINAILLGAEQRYHRGKYADDVQKNLDRRRSNSLHFVGYDRQKSCEKEKHEDSGTNGRSHACRVGPKCQIT